MEEEVLYRYIKGQTTGEEDLEIAAWMDADPAAHQHQLDQIHFLYEMSELYGDQTKVCVEPRHRGIPLRRVAWYFSAVAASLLLLVGVWQLGSFNTYHAISTQMTKVEVPYGQRINITLADGSLVWLNAGAKLEYPVVFKKDLRQVKLSGEAMFEVQHNGACPFEVETFATKIKVLGTKFNINADKDHNYFSATLLQGAVQVTNLLNSRQEKIIMQPNDVVNLANGQLYVEKMKDPELLCWTTGLVNISGLSFQELISKFEQVFDVKIVIDRKRLPTMGAISGKIRVNDGIESALHILQYAANFTYERNAETNIVTIK